jgi:hypothetical protein
MYFDIRGGVLALSYSHVDCFIGVGNWSTRKKSPDLSQDIDKLIT